MRNEKFNILIDENATSDEVVDSIADVFEIGITLENALKDGFQLIDVLAAVQLEPTVKEVINDFPEFLRQFKQLSGDTAIQAVSEARARTIATYGQLGKISQLIYGILGETAYTYQFIQNSIVTGTERLNGWRGLFDSLENRV